MAKLADQTNAEPLLKVRELTKIFGTLKACDQVNLIVRPGEIHALLGENGAGKSTLVKMLFGSLQPVSGEIFWRGKKVEMASPAIARSLGVGMVFQHFSLFDALTAAENIALSLDRTTPLAEIAKRARGVGEAYGLPLDPDALVGDLSVGERQRIEIIRCLLQQPDLIILDEPTSVLTPQEADKLFVTLERLRDEGKSILYISHRLEEVRRLCDRATVLRHGKVVGHCDPGAETAASLARLMVGSEIHAIERDPSGAPAKVDQMLIEVRNLSQRGRGPFSVAVQDVNLAVHAGEIVGVAGVAGNGQGELFDALSGEVTQTNADMVHIRGQAVGRSGINARRRLGAAFVPEERLGHGAVPDLPLTDNLLLSRCKTDAKVFLNGFLKILSQSSLAAATKRIVAHMDVRKSRENPDASALSGGNLQKFLIGRELDRKPSVLIVNQPTWGVDAGAAAHIRQALVDLAKSGSAVVVISQDLDELFEISDRMAAMVHGRLSETVPIIDMTMERIGLMMGGVDDRPATTGAA